MTAIEHIKAACEVPLTDAHKKPVVLKLNPPLTSAEIDALQQRVAYPLPEELRTLLAFCSGIEGSGVETIDFTSSGQFGGLEEIFPHGLSIAADGFGNFWVLDLTPQTSQVAPVFFACHDAPVVLYQSPDITSFLSEVFRMDTPPYKSLINDVQEDRLFDVWRKNPGVMNQPEAAVSSDSEIRAFASGLPEHFKIVDLRNASPGMGFSWARYGHRTELRRHGLERIFAYAKPPRTGLFAKLFGR